MTIGGLVHRQERLPISTNQKVHEQPERLAFGGSDGSEGSPRVWGSVGGRAGPSRVPWMRWFPWWWRRHKPSEAVTATSSNMKETTENIREPFAETRSEVSYHSAKLGHVGSMPFTMMSIC